MELVNEERWNNGGLPPLKRSAVLDGAAEGHSSNMATRDFFAHCDVDTGDSPWDRMMDAGYYFNGAAENIAAGYSSPAAVVQAWMNSSGHRANILSTDLRELGIGYHFQSGDQSNVRLDPDSDCAVESSGYGPYFHYWTQNFGKINEVYPLVINREAYETTTRSVVLYQYGQGWAQEMRFRNGNGTWSAWEPYTQNVAWTLSAGNGVKTVKAQIRNGGTTYTVSDTIVLNEPITPTPGPSPTPFVPSNWYYLPAVYQ